MRALRGIIVLILATTAACTRYEYSKPGVTDATLANDLTECSEIARHEAFRDPLFIGGGSRFHGDFFDGRTAHHFQGDYLSSGKLRHRYHRICMLARGYEFVPVPEQ
jgi:hypothetical protein